MAEKDKTPKGGKAPEGAKGGEAKVAKAPKAGGGKKAEAPKVAKPATPRPKDYKPRMKTLYEKVVRDALMKKFAYTNVMLIPKSDMIVINMGVGEDFNYL